MVRRGIGEVDSRRRHNAVRACTARAESARARQPALQLGLAQKDAQDVSALREFVASHRNTL
jgi:hypothetical protein